MATPLHIGRVNEMCIFSELVLVYISPSLFVACTLHCFLLFLAKNKTNVYSLWHIKNPQQQQQGEIYNKKKKKA